MRPVHAVHRQVKAAISEDAYDTGLVVIALAIVAVEGWSLGTLVRLVDTTIITAIN